jgi:hypothetical protein
MMRTGKSLGLAVAAAALLGGAAQAAALGVDQLRDTINRVPMYHIIDNRPNNRRAKVKAARRQNVRRLIAAKHA